MGHDTAIYLTGRLSEIFPHDSANTIETAFCDGYKELIEKLVLLFVDTDLPYCPYHYILIRNLTTSVAEFEGDPFDPGFEMLETEFLLFIENIKQHYPMRETMIEGTSTLIYLNGRVSKAVDFITKGLLELYKATRRHFSSFDVVDYEEPDLVPHVINSFLDTYPSRFRSPLLRELNARSIHFRTSTL